MHSIDKAHPDVKETAHKTFQTIAFAYAILSDERRRRRYDATGNTSESLDLEDDDFDWADFFRAQWKDLVTSSSIGGFKQNYQSSDEERRDVLAAYEKSKGSMNKLFGEVMLSNPIDDEERFRDWIDEGIQNGDIPAYDAYTKETTASKKKRRAKAEREAREADEHLREIDSRGKKGSKQENGMGDLAALIQQRQQARANNFLDGLEAKYAGARSNGTGKKGKGKRRKEEEPPEEAFQMATERASKRKKTAMIVEEEHEIDDDDDEIDLDEASEEDDEDTEGKLMRGRKAAKAVNARKEVRKKKPKVQ